VTIIKIPDSVPPIEIIRFAGQHGLVVEYQDDVFNLVPAPARPEIDGEHCQICGRRGFSHTSCTCGEGET